MLKIQQLIMSRKFLPVMLVLTAASLFVAFKTQGKGDRDNPKSKYAKVLRNVGILLEEGHYSPKKINDDFSKQVFKKFLDDLDGDKNILLQKDIDGFKKYETKIDDEIHGSEIESFFAVNTLYQQRLAETAELYKSLLNKSFDFSSNETVSLDGEKSVFAKTEAERTESWRKRLKYLVLDKYAILLDDREKGKGKKDFVAKADSTLEREARDQVRKQLDRYFATKKNRETKDEIFATFVNAITTTMDPHTDYFPPVDLRSFNEGMSGRFFGIGAQLKEDEGKIKIASLIAGGPAWKSGEMKENDEIIKIGQASGEAVDVTGYAVTDAVKLIRGAEKGSEVKLTLRKIDGSIKVVSLKRDEIKLDDVFAKSAIINGEHKIGYIYLPEFYADFERPNGARCAVDVAKEIEKLKAEKVEGIVLDLRGNGGGSLYDVVQMAGLFIEEGPVCQVKSRDDKPNVLRDKDKNILYTGPLTVMVDETSASASEIFAAAIQDYKRGVIVGSTSTYGKGTVQRNIPLNPDGENSLFGGKKDSDDLGSVKLTLQKFYRINGGATQLKGVVPDVIIPDRLELIKIREKDSPSSLSWDEIPKADYKPWTGNYSIDAIAKTANEQVLANKTFSRLRALVLELDKQNDREYSLNINKYKTELKTVKNAYKELDSLYKIAVAMNINNLEADKEKFNADKDKTEKNKQWIKRVSEDVYINEVVKMMNNMIGQDKLAKAN
jgi:carboxyl-terminal processing protease